MPGLNDEVQENLNTGAPEAAAINDGDQHEAEAQPVGQAAASFLDALTADDEGGDSGNEAAGDSQAAAGEAEQEAAAGDEAAADPAAEAKKPEGEQPAADADAEEQEILAGIKSERGRERIGKMLAERKQAMADVEEFRNMVVSTGMSADDFAQTLQYGRLVSSGDPGNLRVALEMLDNQRAALCAQLGIEAPGVDLLAEHADLKEAVEGLEITRERALELARLRKHESQIREQRESQAAGQRGMEEFKQQVQGAAQVMQTYLESRKHEVDHGARLNAVRMHFANPENMQKFVTTHKPEQWPAAIAFLYDNIATQAPQRSAPAGGAPQPLRGSPQNLGNPAPHGATPEKRVEAFLDSLC